MERLVPTEKEWFDYNNNKYCSWLLSFISSSSSYYKNNLYYSKAQYIVDLPLIKKFLGIKNKKSIDKYIDKLKEIDYLKEDEKNYYPINYTDKTYLLIDKELLYNICVTKSTLTIQIFVYLMYRMNMKINRYNENTYNFTIKEIKGILGYSTESQNANIENTINECIQTLKAEHYIDYYVTYVKTDKSIKGNYVIPNHILTYVCSEIPLKLNEIKKEEKSNKEKNSNNFIF